MYSGYLQDFYLKKCKYKCLDVPCVYFHIKIIEMKHDLTNILKSNTSSDDMNERLNHWLDSFECCTRSILLFLHNNSIISFMKRVGTSLLDHHQVSLIYKMRQDVILLQPSNCYLFF